MELVFCPAIVVALKVDPDHPVIVQIVYFLKIKSSSLIIAKPVISSPSSGFISMKFAAVKVIGSLRSEKASLEGLAVVLATKR